MSHNTLPEPDPRCDRVRIGIVSISDRASSGVYQDQGLPALQDWLTRAVRNPIAWEPRLIPDEQGLISATLCELVDQAGCDLVLLCNQSVPTAPGGGRALDDLLDGLATGLAKGRWQASERSEQRRLALLPTAAALSWDRLVAHPAHAAALARLRSISSAA